MNVPLIQANLFCLNNVGSDQERADLMSKIERLKQSDVSQTHNNDRCWRFNNYELDFWLLQVVESLVRENWSFYCRDQIFADNTCCEFNYRSWINYNEPLSRNVLHSHNSAHLSGVYYVSANDTGNIRFLNPANVLGNCNFNAPYVRDFEFSPTDGDLIMWPSWIPHEVEPNLSKKPRINIAFDIEFNQS